MAVLYRKYRPQIFAEVLNQKYIIQTLENQLSSDTVAHAYLFTGSRGVGKTSVARILAKALNCKGRLISGSADQRIISAGDACGVCDVCKQVEANNFIDLVEIDAASNTGVDNIRELIEHVKFAPSLGKYKVFIIDEVHMLSKGAFNALLKTLEEPPKHAVFILATTEINKVPATIISRTQRFDFKALSAEDLFTHLQKVANEENIKLNSDVLNLVAEAAEGSVRDSLSLLGKVLSLGDNPEINEVRQLLGVTDISVCENLLELMAQGKAKDLPDFFEQLSETAPDFKILNRDFLEYLRKCLIYKLTQSSSGIAKEREEKMKQICQNLSVQDLMFFIRLFLRSFKEIETSPIAQIALLLASVEGALKKAPSQQTSERIGKPATTVEYREQTTPIGPIVQQRAPVVAQATISKEEVIVEEQTSLSYDEVVVTFPKVIARIKQINGPLSSVLRGAKLLEPKNGRVVLGVKFLFDKQSLENAKNLSLIREVLQEIFAKNVGFVVEITKEEKSGLLDQAASLTEALQVFGGELVE